MPSTQVQTEDMGREEELGKAARGQVTAGDCRAL